MQDRPHPEWFSLAAGSLLLIAGVRDLIAPGFLNISHSHPSLIDAVCALGAGAMLLWRAFRASPSRVRS
jgi:hypothetical protein